MTEEKQIINNDQINKLIDQYLIDHNDEIVEMINNKIRIAVNKAISESFKFDTYNPNNSGDAYLRIQKIVKNEIKTIIPSITINKTDIQQKINKRVDQLINQHIKSVKLNFK